jgi:hypothetical protein
MHLAPYPIVAMNHPQNTVCKSLFLLFSTLWSTWSTSHLKEKNLKHQNRSFLEVGAGGRRVGIRKG